MLRAPLACTCSSRATSCPRAPSCSSASARRRPPVAAAKPTATTKLHAVGGPALPKQVLVPERPAPSARPAAATAHTRKHERHKAKKHQPLKVTPRLGLPHYDFPVARGADWGDTLRRPPQRHRGRLAPRRRPLRPARDSGGRRRDRHARPRRLERGRRLAPLARGRGRQQVLLRPPGRLLALDPAAPARAPAGDRLPRPHRRRVHDAAAPPLRGASAPAVEARLRRRRRSSGYLRTWRIARPRAAAIPRPATLRAPKGAPRRRRASSGGSCSRRGIPGSSRPRRAVRPARAPEGHGPSRATPPPSRDRSPHAVIGAARASGPGRSGGAWELLALADVVGASVAAAPARRL